MIFFGDWEQNGQYGAGPAGSCVSWPSVIIRTTAAEMAAG